MIPIVATLASQGLTMLANAVMAKGQQVVEDKLGIKLDTAKPEELRQAEIDHEEFLINAAIERQKLDIEADKAAQAAVTSRWQADMLSDSWLSKNIRPMVLIYLLLAFTVMALLSAFGIQVTQAYVELLAQMLMLVMGAYFLGRTVEKLADMRERGRE